MRSGCEQALIVVGEMVQLPLPDKQPHVGTLLVVGATDVVRGAVPAWPLNGRLALLEPLHVTWSHLQCQHSSPFTTQCVSKYHATTPSRAISICCQKERKAVCHILAIQMNVARKHNRC